jgi:uridine kinase
MDNSQKLVIGLVGAKGSGKGTFTPLLRQVIKPRHVELVKTVDLLFDVLALWNLPATRENLQKMAGGMREVFGNDVLIQAIAKKVHDNPSEIIIVDSIRWHADQEMIKSFPQHLMVYIKASPEIRYNRLINRNEKVGESEMSFEQFMKEEQAITEQFIPEIGQQADFIIENESTLEDFEKQVKEFVEKFLQ